MGTSQISLFLKTRSARHAGREIGQMADVMGGDARGKLVRAK